MKGLYDGEQLRWTTDKRQQFEEIVSANQVKCLSEVYKCQVERLLLFPSRSLRHVIHDSVYSQP